MKYLIGIAGLFIICFLAWIVSSDRKAVRYRPIAVLFLCQFIFGLALLKTNVGNNVVNTIAGGFGKLLQYAGEGVNFVFGGLVNDGAYSFFLSVLLPIVFISGLIGILHYCRILGFIIKYTGIVLSKITGMGKLESYNAAASMILGQSEVFISVKKQLGILPSNRLYTLCTSAMSTVSMSIVGAYMTMLEPKYVVTAIVLNVFGGFIVVSLINPYRVNDEEDLLELEQGEKQSFFEVLIEYILDGFKVAMIVGAMLIGFIALITMANALFSALFGVSFQDCLGYVFAPLAFLIGIPWEEAVKAGSLMATKVVSNEFVAMINFSQGNFGFSERTTAIISVFLVSFANFSSIGIIVGAIKALDNRQGNVAARFGLKLVYGASLVSFLSAAVVGLLV